MALSAGQNWVQRLAARLFGIRYVQDGGTLLVDGEGQPREYDTLNAVFPLRTAANHPESRFDLSIEPGALDPNVPVNDTVYVDAVVGTVDGEAGNANKPFQTLTQAIAAANALLPGPTNQIAIEVRPGFYPFGGAGSASVLPSYVHMYSSGGRDVTVIAAASATDPIVTLSPSSSIRGFTLSGANGVGGIGLVCSGAGQYAAPELTILDCTTGFYVTGSGATLVAPALVLLRVDPTWAMDIGGRISAGARAIVESGSLTAIPIARPSIGLLVEGPSQAFVANTVHDGPVVGIRLDDGAQAFVTESPQLNCDVGFSIPATGGAANLQIGVTVVSTTAWDLLVETASASIYLYSVQLDLSKVSVTPGAFLQGLQYQREPTQLQGSIVHGSLSVGSPFTPGLLATGGGGPNVSNMLAYTHDGGTGWTDVTEEAKSITGSAFDMFSALTAGAAFYIGCDKPFPAHRIDVASIHDLTGGTVVCEYWDGASWELLKWMQTDAVFPHASTADAVAGTQAGLNDLRHGPRPGWVAHDEGGNLPTAYWLRWRISAGPITLSAKLERVQVHSDSTLFDEQGFALRFGRAEPYVSVDISPNWFVAAGASPGNQNLAYGANLFVGYTENVFANAVSDQSGYVLGLPINADTSYPFVLKIKWQPSTATAGDVLWHVYYRVIQDDDLAATSPPGPAGEKLATVVTPAAGVTGKGVVSVLELDVADAIATDDLAIAVMIRRVGGDALDTYAGSAILRSLAADIRIATPGAAGD